jgi:hypothetical protein
MVAASARVKYQGTSGGIFESEAVTPFDVVPIALEPCAVGGTGLDCGRAEESTDRHAKPTGDRDLRLDAQTALTTFSAGEHSRRHAGEVGDFLER